MAKMEIALDLGTAYTSIFVAGNGIVLHEPSVIAYFEDGSKRHTRAVGSEAYNMMGRAPEKTKTVCPIADGVIKDTEACTDMLTEFIGKILPESYLIKPRISCVLGVPTGITVEGREAYEQVLMRAGIDDITMVNSIMLEAIGVDMPVQSTFGGIVVSIGAGSTEIAVLSLCGIVRDWSLTIGGDMIDRALMDAISGIYELNIGRATARVVKEKICSLIRNDCAAMNISGIDIQSKTIRTQAVSADKLYNAIYDYYMNIVDAVASVINTCSPSIAAEIQRYGIVVAGGGAKMPGLAQLMRNVLKLDVRVPGEACHANILGGGRLLSDPDLLNDILAHV